MTFTISFTAQELEIIGQALAQAPYGVVVGLVNKINQQIAEQQKPLEEDA